MEYQASVWLSYPFFKHIGVSILEIWTENIFLYFFQFKVEGRSYYSEYSEFNFPDICK